MRSKYKYLVSAAFSALFGLLVAFSANAQHRGGGGGGSRGGGSFHGGGGAVHSSGGFHGGSSFHGNTGGSRPSMSRPSGPPRGGSPAVRGNSAAASRGNIRTNSTGRIGATSHGNVVTRGYSGRAPVTAYRGGNVYRGGAYRGGVYRGGAYGGRIGLYGRGYNRFYNRNAFYNRYYLPRLGFHLSVLPFGYYPFYWGDYQYYYSDGYYYQGDNNNYTVVEPPLGAILNQLPAGATSIMIDGQQYYELKGVYYQAVTQDDGSTGYQIAGKDGELSTGASDNGTVDQGTAAAAPVVGDIVDVLPPDCNTVKINGQKYFVSPDGYYYQQDYDSNNRLVYKVAGTPTDEPSN